jgi:hypothetical protein
MNGVAKLEDVLAIVGHDCQSKWTPEYVRYFFAGNETIDALYLLDAKGPEDIPILDKLWVIDRCGMLTAAQKSSVIAIAAELITDKTSEYFQRYVRADRPIYSYGPICNFLAESTGQDRLSFCSQIEAVLIAAVRRALCQ